MKAPAVRRVLPLAILAAGLAAGDAPRPTLTVPRLAQAPVADGTFAAGEWDRAACVTGFICANGPMGGAMDKPDARILLGHDGARLYMAVECDLLPGQAPSRNYRKRDEPVYMDSYQTELWLTPPVRSRLTTYQAIFNAYGAIFDNKQVPDLGAVTAGWGADWKVGNSYEVGKVWRSEISVPFKDFGETSVRPSEPWGGLVAVAWPQRSWPFTGGWYKNTQNHALYSFADDGTCARLKDLSSLFDGRLEPKIELVNSGKVPLVFTLRFAIGETVRSETVQVAAGASQAWSKALEMPAADARRSLRLDITAGGRTLLGGDWSFQPIDFAKRAPPKIAEPPKPFATRCQFAPIAMGVKAWADLLDYGKRAQLKTVRFRIVAKGGDQPVVAQDVTSFGYDSAESYLWLPRTLAFGDYELVSEFLAADGALLDAKRDAFQHTDLAKRFPWLGNTLGTTITPSAPFTPLVVRGNTALTWGREHRFAGALPEQIISQGEDLLAMPVALVAEIGGKTVVATSTKAFAADTAGTFVGSYSLPGIDLDLAATIAFDGMILYDLTARKGSTATVERLYLRVPVKASRALTFHSTAGGWSGAFDLVPTKSDAKPFWTSDAISDFVPYVGLSDDDRSLTWFADDDHGWILGKERPCAELVRSAEAAELRINLVRRAGSAEGLSARFGLIAGPVKPLPSGWRNTSLDFRSHYGSKVNIFYGAGHGNCPIPPHDTAKLAKLVLGDIGGQDPDQALAKTPPWTGDLPVYKPENITLAFGNGGEETVARQVNALRPGMAKSCYFFNAMMYFEGWDAKAFQAFFPGDWSLDPASGWFHLSTVPSYRDFFAYHMDLWMKHWSVPGFYFDECYLPVDFNVFNGNGKVMPDGSVRGRVPLLGQRAYLQRMRQLFLDNQRPPLIWVHTSNYMAPHAISSVDVAMHGEDRFPNDQTDYIDAAPASLLRSIGRSQKYGFIPVWMDQAGRGGRFDLSRQVWGWVWQHDAVPEYHTCAFNNPLLGLRIGWGIAEDDVRFLPYWNNPAVRSSDPELLISAWTRPGGKVLLQAMNLRRSAGAPASITLDAAALGLKSGFAVRDLEGFPAWVELRTQMMKAFAEKDLKARSAAYNALYGPCGQDQLWSSWKPEQLPKLADGAAFQLVVPPRDFRTIIVE